MGRGIDSKAYEKHNIKRAVRLCSNPHLLSASLAFDSRSVSLHQEVHGLKNERETRHSQTSSGHVEDHDK